MDGTSTPDDVRYTYCRICEARCGMTATVRDGRIVRLAPDKQNPYTWRDFCVKGKSAHELITHPNRILTPMRRVEDRYVQASWDDAVGDIAARLTALRDEHGPDSIAVYYGNPSGFSGTTPAFVTAFMDAVGTNNRYNVTSIDNNVQLVVAERMYGRSVMPLVPDVDACDCFLFVGANPAESAMNWVANVPDGWRRVLAAQGRGATLIVVDPRRTPTAARADTHVAIVPGADWAFLLGVLKVILDEHLEDATACAAERGIDELRRLVADADLPDLAERCDVPLDTIVSVARRFASARTAMCISRTGPAQTLAGTAAEWLSYVLNHVTGRVDVPGGRFYNPGYIDFASIAATFGTASPHLSRVRGLPMVSGAHSLSELPDEILTPGPGQVRAVVICAGNPVVSGPNGALLDRALASLDLLVCIDLLQRESHRHADWLIPAAHFLEREDLTPFVGMVDDLPFAQMATPVVDPPPGVREEWRFLLDLIVAMDLPLFGSKETAAAIAATRREAAERSEDVAGFDPHDMYRSLLATAGKLTLEELLAAPHGLIYEERTFGHFRSQVATPDGKVELAPADIVADVRRRLSEAPMPREAGVDGPFHLISRRRKESMNSWTNDWPTIQGRLPANTLEMHPADAARLGVCAGAAVDVSSHVATVRCTVEVSEATREGVVVSEHGWGSRIFDPTTGTAAWEAGFNRNLVVDNAVLDPLSQVPALNGQLVRIVPA